MSVILSTSVCLNQVPLCGSRLNISTIKSFVENVNFMDYWNRLLRSLILLNEILIAPCGMNCSICMAYLRKRNKCPGCREPDINKPITRVICKIKTCEILTKNQLTFCDECEKFPCDNLVVHHLLIDIIPK